MIRGLHATKPTRKLENTPRGEQQDCLEEFSIGAIQEPPHPHDKHNHNDIQVF